MHTSGIDFSSEFTIQKFGNGVKLTRSENADEARSVGYALKQAFSFCLLNTESEVMCMNVAGAEVNGFASEYDVVGKSLFDLYERHNAETLRHDDISILQQQQTRISENHIKRKDGTSSHNLIVDAPWYDQHNRLIGILGFSAVISAQSIEPMLNYLRALGLLAPAIPTKINNIDLTKRELSCLEQLARGKSYRQIGLALSLSPRTVEHCIERVKDKFGLRTKFQLIDAVSKYYQ